MGDISRHRDIHFDTRDVIPTNLLSKCKLSVNDLTYLELGNFLTDVSQFRDPVYYIFAKQRIWRDFIIPNARDETTALRVISALAALASVGAAQLVDRLAGGTTEKVTKAALYTLAGAGGILASLPTDLYADLFGADDWVDLMFGTPIEKIQGDPNKRDDKHYGYVGQFFRHFMEGITHLLFADQIPNQVGGKWGRINRIPQSDLSKVVEEFFTQYYPHEHTDQPPYVWDASKRPNRPSLYGPSKRQRNLVDTEIGVMNVVDKHYVQYLAEGLADLEYEWRRLKPDDSEKRHKMLVRMGKLLHGIEDWFFHSNVVEILRMRSHKPPLGESESDEAFLRSFVEETAKKDPEFKSASPTEKVRLQRRFYRRLRFPVFLPGTKTNSAGKLSPKESNLSLRHAYPAFPSQQDTAHTLLHALENLEIKVKHSSSSGASNLLAVAPCVLNKFVTFQGSDGQNLVQEKAQARGLSLGDLILAFSSSATTQRDLIKVVIIDVLRELLPLVVTLLLESERQRLIADVDPMAWSILDDKSAQPQDNSKQDNADSDKKSELDKQLERHQKALKPQKNENGVMENNYERAARYLVDCGYLNPHGQQAIKKAFEIDQKSESILKSAPGSGGFLIRFAIDLQHILDEGDANAEKLNKDEASIFSKATDNKVFNETIGSHSLMSKDTLESPPFFNDAKVLAGVASSSVFHIMLEQVSTPPNNRRLPWKVILHHLIRYPVAKGGWERRSIDFYNKNGRIPKYAELPEFARLVNNALNSKIASEPWVKGTKVKDLEAKYTRLEIELSNYRYP